MDSPNVTSPQSEPDQDNSSLQNPSTNPAEAGTTDETRDDDHETSSIEALNWSEVEEEELAAAQQAEALAAVATLATSQGKSVETKVNPKADKDDDTTSVTNNGSSTAGSSAVLLNEEGNVLSTSLLQSINSSVSDEDPQARKLSVIENWASEVTNAVERGEIEMAEDFPDENGATGDDEDDTEEDVKSTEGVRKRKGKKLSPEMVSSSASHAESIVDPLSNAPVLDDGPIWNKGPRSYTFQENRRINQKLTFCLLIVVVLAIGLGLGNLVAHQECEAEYKASQKSQQNEKSPVHAGTIPTTTTPTPIIPDRSTDSTLPNNRAFPSVDSQKQDSEVEDEDYDLEKNIITPEEAHAESETEREETVIRKRDEPIIDPKYRVHAETLSKVVYTLDRLSQKIDKFENNTRKLQGVLMIPDKEEEEEDKSSSSMFDEEIHKDDGNMDKEEPLDEEEDDDDLIDELIDGIEQTPNYLELKKAKKQLEDWKELEKTTEQRPTLLNRKVPRSKESESDVRLIEKTIRQFQEFQRRFIKKERKRLKDEGKYHKLRWRLPEEYTVEERNALRVRYKASWNEFVKFVKAKVPDPVLALFGEEEEEEERTYGDVFHYPFPDPDDDLTDEEYTAIFERNLEESLFKLKETPDANEVPPLDIDIPEAIVTEKEPETTVEEVESRQSEAANDDLVLLESGMKPEEINFVDEKQSSNEEMEESKENIVSGKYESAKPIVTSSDSQVPVNSEKTQAAPDTNTENSSTLKETTDENYSPSVRVKTEDVAPRPTSVKLKKVEDGVESNLTGNKKVQSGQGQNENGKPVKRDIKQKEQKVRQGKQKSNNKNKSNGNVGNGGGGNGKEWKMSNKATKKIKNFESNKVFETVKGKNNEKRRRTPVDSKETQPRDKKVSGSRATRESTNGRGRGETYSAPNEKRKTKQTKVNRNNNINGPPKYYDPKDIQDQQRQQNPGKEKRMGGESSQENLKYENKDFSSKETQHRQQKQEFNTNYGSRQQAQNVEGNYNQGKKSKNWQNKENRSKEKTRERTWGN